MLKTGRQYGGLLMYNSKKLIFIILFSVVNNAYADVIEFEDIGYVQYGDAQSYSLPIAQIQDDCTSPGCAYRIASSPGHIQDLIVVATGTNNNPVNTNFTGMDNAYSTPTGKSGSNFFSTGTVADPTAEPNFSGDADGTWDSTLAALKSFLDGEKMLFMFNNNNLNGGNLQSLAAWMQITLTNSSNEVISTYDLTNNNSPYDLVSQGGGGTYLGDVTTYTSDGSDPDGNSNDNTDYVLSGGPICINTDTPVPIPVPCDGSGVLPVSEGPINHNLGADEVAYAVLFPELNAELEGLFESLTELELDQYTMNIDLRLGCDPALFGAATDENCSGDISGYGKNINNGYEQLFISSYSDGIITTTTVVTEPSSLLIMLSSLLLLVNYRRNNKLWH